MKLLTKTSIYYVVIVLALFSVAGAVLYVVLSREISRGVNEHLYNEKTKIIKYVEKTEEVPDDLLPIGDIILFRYQNDKQQEIMKDTILFNANDGELDHFRQLVFPLTVGGENYSATIITPLTESEDVIGKIIVSMLVVAGSLLLVLFVVNQWLSKRIWKPFYSTLANLHEFDVSKKEKIVLGATSIREFSALNEEIGKMTEKIQRDYQSLKEFTENASHEIQTPLSIIRTQLELAMQSDSVSQDQSNMLQEVYESANRLSKLIHSLLLLSKIENRQFQDVQIIDLKEHVVQKLRQFEEMIQFKNITVDELTVDAPEVMMSERLADIVLSNILGNAIKHTPAGGTISIELEPHSLVVSNTGLPLTMPSEKLFERFQKNDPSSDSAGLGLAIIKQICDTYHFSLEYSYAESIHRISISF